MRMTRPQAHSTRTPSSSATATADQHQSLHNFFRLSTSTATVPIRPLHQDEVIQDEDRDLDQDRAARPLALLT